MKPTKTPPAPPAKKGPARPEDVLKAAMDALAMPQEEFDARLDAFEQERDRKAQEALKNLKK